MKFHDRFAVIDYEVFDVRYKREIPGLDFDIYISSGGPGDPLDGDGVWDKEYFDLMDQLWEHNKNHAEKKFVFFVCHSFQMICHHMGIGTISLRRKESFGLRLAKPILATLKEALGTGSSLNEIIQESQDVKCTVTFSTRYSDVTKDGEKITYANPQVKKLIVA